jgi:hypothetical protein
VEQSAVDPRSVHFAQTAQATLEPEQLPSVSHEPLIAVSPEQMPHAVPVVLH